MKVFLVSRKTRVFDEYYHCVIVAHNEEEAKNLFPIVWPKGEFLETVNHELLEVEEINPEKLENPVCLVMELG